LRFFSQHKVYQALSEDRGEDNEEEIDCNILTRITVLVKDNTIDYVVTSFPVVWARLVEVKLEWVNCQGEIETFDGFVRDCNALNHSLPADLTIPYNNQHAL